MAKKKKSTGKRIAKNKPVKAVKKVSGTNTRAKGQKTSNKPANKPHGKKRATVNDFYEELLKVSQKPQNKVSKNLPKPTQNKRRVIADDFHQELLKVSQKPVKKVSKVKRQVPPPVEKPSRKNKKTVLKTEVLEGKSKSEVRKSYLFEDKPLSTVNLEKARKKTIQKEKKKIYSKRSSLKKKLKGAQSNEERQLVLNEIYRTSRWLESASEATGRKKKKATFTQQIETVGPQEIKQNTFVWEASKLIDNLIDSGRFKRFIIDGEEFRASDVMDILSEYDDLADEAAFDGGYFVEVFQDTKNGIVNITLPTPKQSTDEE
jgi:hypothetical protein